MGAFAVWSIARSYDPAIDHTEQPMDFAFLNANIVADSFPPQDPWLSGNSISYYYFGYLMNGSLSKLTGVSSGISYNLALSLLFALTAVGAFGLIVNLIRLYRGRRGGRLGVPIAFGSLGALFVVGIGNLEGSLESARSMGLGWSGFWNWLGIKGMSGNAEGTALFPSDNWWWWRSSRVIDTLEDGLSLDYTITESPSFSFVLGDLHPHVMSIPFVLLALGLGLQALRSQEAFGTRWIRTHPLPFLLIVVSLGALGFLNSWDLPTSVAIFLSLTLLASYRVWGRWDWERFRDWAIFAGVLAGLSLVLFLPFLPGPQYPGQRGLSRRGCKHQIYPLCADIRTVPLFLALVSGFQGLGYVAGAPSPARGCRNSGAYSTGSLRSLDIRDTGHRPVQRGYRRWSGRDRGTVCPTSPPSCHPLYHPLCHPAYPKTVQPTRITC